MSAVEQLVRKKRVHGGHKGSATKMMTEVDNILSAHSPTDVSTRLTQLKQGLLDKLDTIKHLNDEVVDLTEEEEDLVREQTALKRLFLS